MNIHAVIFLNNAEQYTSSIKTSNSHTLSMGKSNTLIYISMLILYFFNKFIPYISVIYLDKINTHSGMEQIEKNYIILYTFSVYFFSLQLNSLFNNTHQTLPRRMSTCTSKRHLAVFFNNLIMFMSIKVYNFHRSPLNNMFNCLSMSYSYPHKRTYMYTFRLQNYMHSYLSTNRC